MSALASIFTAGKALQGEPSISGTDNPSAGGLLDQAISLWGKGADIYNAVAGPKTPVAPSGQVAATASANAAPDWKKYLPWALGGLALIAVLYFVARKS